LMSTCYDNLEEGITSIFDRDDGQILLGGFSSYVPGFGGLWGLRRE